MDILTHIISGAAIGTVLAGFSKKGILTQFGIITLSGIGATLPDLDAISLWSGFDKTIGSLLNLEHSGREIYSSKFWYSHHGFLHSFIAGVLIAFILGTLVYIIKSGFKDLSTKMLLKDILVKKLFYIGFISGFLIHLFEDMPTPSSAWGGVNFFWPSTSYIGGTGDIWWWNNYDIFLIAAGAVIINGILLAIKHFTKARLKLLLPSVFFIGFSLSIYLINTRGFDFNYVGDTKRFDEYENKSKEIQKQILGEKIYEYMEAFDKKLKINF